MYDANTGEVVPDPKFQDQHATYKIPKGYGNEGDGTFKVPIPDKPGKYYVKLKLFSPDRPGESKRLDVAKSETIQIYV